VPARHDHLLGRVALNSAETCCAVGPNRAVILVAILGWGILHRGNGAAFAHPAPLQLASQKPRFSGGGAKAGGQVEIPTAALFSPCPLEPKGGG
jgi:hypothetical protein